VLLAGFSLPQLASRRLMAERLAPLGLVYALAGLRLIVVYGLGQPAPPAWDYAAGLALSAAWAALMVLRQARRLWLAWWLTGLASAGLMTGLLVQRAPAGVTGSDPFAYVQTALDLARHGRLRHHYPLAPLAGELGLPRLPVTHVGYVLPDEAGLAPTVWPPGFSVMLAIAYRLGGESAMLRLNAWVGLAVLVTSGLLAVLLMAPYARRARWPAGLAAVAILGTSSEQFVRLAAPLADGAAQCLTAAAVAAALAAVHSARQAAQPASAAGDLRFAVLGGLAGAGLGIAYTVRYTQALLMPGLLLAAVFMPARMRRAYVLPLAGVALLAALPDVIYRTRLYAWPWRFGTGELALFTPGALPEALRRVAPGLLAAAEFGWLWPLAMAGVAWLWRRQRPVALVLAAAYLPPLVFHLWYPFLRLRDILFIYTPLAALAGLGAVVLAAWLWRLPAHWALGLRAAAVGGLLIFAAARFAPLLTPQPGFYTFGHLLPEQRRGLEALASLTEPQAVIACSLNSGAVELYGQRLAVRPGAVLQPGAGWSDEQWLAFVARLVADGRPVYVLVDSPELDGPLAAVAGRYRLQHVADLYLPVFYHGGGSLNQVAPLYRVLAR
jgi:4-amino-4-deoxy-L-arabinose transferase-like glycosyltransferase